ncbi:craniofacial development protein 2-like [Dendronephthya gigantea]|uniref:craniofacial development protein 2-like n=1 Tax=Dendronephthya gigantea TaxID=151771 RepID=UPI0010693469|nr:craniofacial development protein 2-like [Dendronephthya gigantea]
MLQKVTDKTPRHDMIMMMGDWNAKIGAKQEGEDGVVGRHGLGDERSENGVRFVSFCAANNLAIVSTMFPHKNIHKYTWTAPNGKTRNQIDHVTMNGKFKRSVRDTRSYRGADCGSDHNLVITTVRLCLLIPEVRQQFQIKLRNRFSCLADESTEVNEQDVETRWTNIKESYKKTAQEVLGYRKKQSKPWISATSWKKIDERRLCKAKVDSTRSERLKAAYREEYQAKDKDAKKQLRRDKRNWIDQIASDAEKAAKTGNMKAVFDATRQFCNKPNRRTDSVRSKEGILLTKEEEVKKRWKEHFAEVLNRPPPTRSEVESVACETLEIETGPATHTEIRKAIQQLKNGNAGGVDGVTTELMKQILKLQ